MAEEGAPSRPLLRPAVVVAAIILCARLLLLAFAPPSLFTPLALVAALIWLAAILGLYFLARPSSGSRLFLAALGAALSDVLLSNLVPWLASGRLLRGGDALLQLGWVGGLLLPLLLGAAILRTHVASGWVGYMAIAWFLVDLLAILWPVSVASQYLQAAFWLALAFDLIRPSQVATAD